MNDLNELLKRIEAIEERLSVVEEMLCIDNEQDESVMSDSLATELDNVTGETVTEVDDAVETESKSYKCGNYTYSAYGEGVRIDYYAFDEIEEIQIPSQLGGKTVLAIGKESFCRLPVKRVILPPTLRSIEDKAFFNCNKLVSISFPESLESLGREVFCDCYSLMQIEFPTHMEKMDFMCFGGCHSLESVTLPIIKKVPNGCFSACHIRNLTIPEGVEEIGNSAFACCPLDRVVLPKSLKVLGSDVFSRSKKYETIDIIVLSDDTIIEGFALHQFTTVYCRPGSEAEKVVRKVGDTVSCKRLSKMYDIT